MFEVMDVSDISRRRVIATGASFEEAKAIIKDLGVIHMEDDAAFPGTADAFLKDGRLMMVQPVGFVARKP